MTRQHRFDDERAFGLPVVSCGARVSRAFQGPRAIVCLVLLGAPLRAFADGQTSSPESGVASSARSPPAEGGAERAASETASTPQPIEHHWYGWQTLIVDGAAVVLTVAGFASGADGGNLALLGLGVGTYVFGTPFVHFAHRNPGRAGISFGMRVVIPLLFGYIGVLSDDCNTGGSGLCALRGGFIGGGIGMAGAIAIDAALLAREDVPARESALPRLRLALDRRRAAIIASGTF